MTCARAQAAPRPCGKLVKPFFFKKIEIPNKDAPFIVHHDDISTRSTRYTRSRDKNSEPVQEARNSRGDPKPFRINILTSKSFVMTNLRGIDARI
jgi:hypothetical protein